MCSAGVDGKGRWELRVHIYQCKDLPAADDDGTSDPYIKVTIAGQTQKTRVIPDTCYPRYYQTLRFQNLELPDESMVMKGCVTRNSNSTCQPRCFV